MQAENQTPDQNQTEQPRPDATAQTLPVEAPSSYIDPEAAFLETCSTYENPRQDLFHLLTLMRRLHDKAVPFRFINGLFGQWLKGAGISEVVEHRDDMAAMFSFLTLLAELREAFVNLDSTTDLIHLQDKDGEVYSRV